MVAMDEITISTKDFKAFSSENRVKMLKLLQQQNHTLTEISKKTSLASPTAKQHLEVLIGAQLVELIDEGRKWKYYHLTKKGKKILESKENQTQVFILLSAATIAFIGAMMLLALPLMQVATDAMTPAAGIESSPLQAQKNFDATTAQEQQNTPTQGTQAPSQAQDSTALIFLAAISGIAVLVLLNKYRAEKNKWR